MKYQVEEIDGFIFHVYFHSQNETEMLNEAKSKGTPLVGTYSYNKHQPHNPTGEYHLHVYDGPNEIFAINQSGKGHDGYSGTTIPNKVFKALTDKFPDWHFPKDRIVESIDEVIAFDFRLKFMRPVIVFSNSDTPTYTGYFHQFADDPFQSHGFFAKTVAIIEAQDGRMKMVSTTGFRFADIQE